MMQINQQKINRNQQQSNFIMEIAVSISIYLAFVIAFTLLLCIVTKYFHAHAETLGIDPGVAQVNCEEIKSQESFDDLQKFEEVRKPALTKKERQKFHLDLEGIREQAQDSYRNTPLLNKFKIQLTPPKAQPSLSKDALKTVRNQQLSTSKFASSRMQPSQSGQTYDFLSKLVGYQAGCITIIELNVSRLTRDGEGSISQQAKPTRSQLKVEEEGEWQFEDYLEVFGFSKDTFGGFRIIATADTSTLMLNQSRQMKGLKVSERTEWISLQEFKELAEKALPQQSHPKTSK